MAIHDHLNLMGHYATDRVTGFKGVITSIVFDLYGCVQATLNPGVNKDGKPGEVFLFDVNRLDVDKKKKKAMELPKELQEPVAAPAQYEKGPGERPKNLFKP